jgi:hypothetical protein
VRRGMKKCAFCTRDADSPEHIFSDWMIELLPSDQRYVCNERIVTRDEYIRYQRKKIRFVARAVCTPCNNGWMSDLEGALKSIIGDVLVGNWGASKTFTVEQQKTIAAFAFKTLVLANHKDLGKKRPFFTRKQRSLFRRNLAIPAGVSVFMAVRENFPGKYYGFWKSTSGDSKEKNIPYNWSLYACTWNFQNIILQAIGMKWKTYAYRKIQAPLTFPELEEWAPASTAIWPPTVANLEWPLEFYLGPNSLLAYRDRFESVNVRFRFPS